MANFQWPIWSFPILNTQNNVNVYYWQCPPHLHWICFINSYLTCFLPAFGKPESPSFSSLKASWLGSLSSFITKLSDISQQDKICSDYSEQCYLSKISHSVFAVHISRSGLWGTDKYNNHSTGWLLKLLRKHRTISH